MLTTAEKMLWAVGKAGLWQQWFANNINTKQCGNLSQGSL